MSKAKKFIDIIKAIKALWSFAKLLEQEDDTEAQGWRTWGPGVARALPSLSGAGVAGWLITFLTEYPWIVGVVLFLAGTALMRLYDIWLVKRYKRKEREREERREKPAWEIFGARSPAFTLGDLACMLSAVDPEYPFPPKAEEEYKVLAEAAFDCNLTVTLEGGVPQDFELGFIRAG